MLSMRLRYLHVRVYELVLAKERQNHVAKLFLCRCAKVCCKAGCEVSGVYHPLDRLPHCVACGCRTKYVIAGFKSSGVFPDRQVAIVDTVRSSRG